MRSSRWIAPLVLACLFLAAWTGLAWADAAPGGCGGCSAGAGLPDPVTALASLTAGGALLWGLRRRR
ncbi:hypothetical protein [Haliangium sp.]|uniref:hypothetical protein n=1 Tax=Haliangium sp. TaxID=2663208 RepID=UPI003D12A481